VTMSMRRSLKLKSLKLLGLVMRKVDIFTLEHDKLVSQNEKNLTKCWKIIKEISNLEKSELFLSVSNKEKQEQLLKFF
jgi:hypothetical protein